MAGTSPSPASPAVIHKVGSATASARPARPKVVAMNIGTANQTMPPTRKVAADRPARVHAICIVGRQLDRRAYLGLRPEQPKELQHLGPPHLCAGAGQPRLMPARAGTESSFRWYGNGVRGATLAADLCSRQAAGLVRRPSPRTAASQPVAVSAVSAVSAVAMHTACRLWCCKFAS